MKGRVVPKRYYSLDGMILASEIAKRITRSKLLSNRGCDSMVQTVGDRKTEDERQTELDFALYESLPPTEDH